MKMLISKYIREEKRAKSRGGRGKEIKSKF